MTVILVRGNALALPLPDRSVDLIVTSPPYFGLRSYQDGGEHYAGQIGDEATPAEFVDALIAATREMVRVLKPAGSIWVNLGDKYARPGGGADINPRSMPGAGKGSTARVATPGYAGAPEKSLIGVPWRYALRCIDDLGLILRAEVIWAKPNGMPESVTDRVRRSHEQWFHFVTQPRYFEAVDEIREPHQEQSVARAGRSRFTPYDAPGQTPNKRAETAPNPLGAMPGSVWTIATQPLQVPEWLDVDHFAAYPMEWPRRIIQGWCPKAYCTVCDQPRSPVVESTAMVIRPSARRAAAHASGVGGGRTATSGTMLEPAKRSIIGYACGCPTTDAPTREAVVLDPFGGTGTAALVADVLGRTGISNDLSADYGRIAQWRTTDPGERAAAMQVPRPAPVPEAQAALF